MNRDASSADHVQDIYHIKGLARTTTQRTAAAGQSQKGSCISRGHKLAHCSFHSRDTGEPDEWEGRTLAFPLFGEASLLTSLALLQAARLLGADGPRDQDFEAHLRAGSEDSPRPGCTLSHPWRLRPWRGLQGLLGQAPQRAKASLCCPPWWPLLFMRGYRDLQRPQTFLYVNLYLYKVNLHVHSQLLIFDPTINFRKNGICFF